MDCDDRPPGLTDCSLSGLHWDRTPLPAWPHRLFLSDLHWDRTPLPAWPHPLLPRVVCAGRRHHCLPDLTHCYPEWSVLGEDTIACLTSPTVPRVVCSETGHHCLPNLTHCFLSGLCWEKIPLPAWPHPLLPEWSALGEDTTTCLTLPTVSWVVCTGRRHHCPQNPTHCSLSGLRWGRTWLAAWQATFTLAANSLTGHQAWRACILVYIACVTTSLVT
jgi:hypothetical protein